MYLMKIYVGMAPYRCFIVCLVVVLSLCTSLSVSAADVFVSIDCGSSLPYKDGDGIAWVGDDRYVQGGESRSVKSYNSVNHVLDTLRVFTTRNKNCYHIDSVKQGRVLVRAIFNYGNYDGKSSPPNFDLQFDGNDWGTVNTSTFHYEEVTYTMKRDSISVCLAQTEPDQFPFISSLEVRSLESYMYRHVDATYPLFIWRRFAFGSNTSFGYPDDPYDRFWAIGRYGKGSIPVTSDALFSELTWIDDQPPPALFKNAITATTPNGSIELFMDLPTNEISAYINWYFSEVTLLKPNQSRSFRIFKDNESYSGPIIPPYHNTTGQYVSGITVSSKTRFSLVPTNVSTLPPLINGVEIFYIGDDPLTDGTDSRDVEGLASLQKGFSVLQSWSGDPCLPSPYTWDWIQCNSDPRPRVTALLLSGYDLSGLLPDFSSMDALQTIDLHNNSLQGPIPEFLGTFPSLKTLNLAINQFSGTIPASLSRKKGLILTVAGNPGLCTSNTSCEARATAPPPPPRMNSSIKMKKTRILELLFPVIILSMIIIL